MDATLFAIGLFVLGAACGALVTRIGRKGLEHRPNFVRMHPGTDSAIGGGVIWRLGTVLEYGARFPQR